MIESINPSDFMEEYRKRFLFYNPHNVQKSFHEAGKSFKQRLFLAGNRTGKTFCGCIEDAMHLTGVYPKWWTGYKFSTGINAWVASETYEFTRTVLQEALLGKDGEKGLIPDSLILEKKRSPHGSYKYVKIRHSSGGTSTLHFKSYDQGRRKFQGARCHLIHLDEEPPYDVFNECLMRLTDVDGSGSGRLIVTMTPFSGVTPLLKSFLDKEPNNPRFHVMATWDDNPHLTEEEKDELRASLLPHELEARERGIPTIGSGLVYPIAESLIRVSPFEIPKHWLRVFGLDFGWHNTAALVCAYDYENAVTYVIGEYKQGEKTPSEHAFKLFNMGLANVPCVYDPAGNSSSQKDGVAMSKLFEDAGLKDMNKADNAVDAGITKTLQLMRDGRLKVFSNLNLFFSELRSYSRVDNKITKRNDHLMDCLRYVVMSGIPLINGKKNINDYYSTRRGGYFGV